MSGWVFSKQLTSGGKTREGRNRIFFLYCNDRFAQFYTESGLYLFLEKGKDYSSHSFSKDEERVTHQFLFKKGMAGLVTKGQF